MAKGSLSLTSIGLVLQHQVPWKLSTKIKLQRVVVDKARDPIVFGPQGCIILPGTFERRSDGEHSNRDNGAGLWDENGAYRDGSRRDSVLPC